MIRPMYLTYIDEDVLIDSSKILVIITYGWVCIPVLSTEQITHTAEKMEDFGNSSYLFVALLFYYSFRILDDGWFCREVIKKNTIWFLWRFYFVKRMWLIPVLYFYARGEKIMIPAIFNSLIEGIFITKWLSKFHKEVFVLLNWACLQMLPMGAVVALFRIIIIIL